MVEVQFVSFLTDRIQAKLSEIRANPSEPKTVVALVDEIRLHVDQLEKVASTTFTEAPRQPIPASPPVPQNRRGNRGGE